MARPHKPAAVVLGGGMWGVVLAQQLAAKARVHLWEFVPSLADELAKTRRHAHIPGLRLDDSVRVGHDLAQACADAEVLLFVLPSHAMAQTARDVRSKTRLSPRALAINASKGVEPRTLATMGDIVERELPALRGKVWTLTGPSFAREVARGVPTGLMLGGPAGPRANRLAALLDGACLRIQPCPDRVGVELGGSLKNVIAIGAGILDGLGAGANTKAVLLVRGLAEIGLIIRAVGGRADTIYGLAGLGDLIATGTSPQSRNRAFGEKLGRGASPRQALAQIPTIVEGVEAADSARSLARRHRVRTPLLDAIFDAAGGEPARGVLRALGFR
ncbi:MAG: NAD(P)H-dependent glycerol-3-phosphate dehydrogenase [Elusimicrobiota bacterium]